MIALKELVRQAKTCLNFVFYHNEENEVHQETITKAYPSYNKEWNKEKIYIKKTVTKTYWPHNKDWIKEKSTFLGM